MSVWAGPAFGTAAAVLNACVGEAFAAFTRGEFGGFIVGWRPTTPGPPIFGAGKGLPTFFGANPPPFVCFVALAFFPLIGVFGPCAGELACFAAPPFVAAPADSATLAVNLEAGRDCAAGALPDAAPAAVFADFGVLAALKLCFADGGRGGVIGFFTSNTL